MKKLVLFVVAFLMLFGNGYCIAEQTGEEEYEEGLFIYTPVQGKLLPWMETENGNEYQIIGLAPHDSTVSLSVSVDGREIWHTEVISEGNGYFMASFPAEERETGTECILNAACLSYRSKISFLLYAGTVTAYAMDPLHLEMLSDLTEDEKWSYEAEMEALKEEEKPDVEAESEQYLEPTKTGPNEYRSHDYSYMMLEDGTISLIFYYGHERDLVIPTILDGFTVSEVAFAGTIPKRGIVTITIPDGVNCRMHPCFNWPNLTAIYVPKDHTTLASVNGLLYTRDLRKLIAVPNAYPDKELAIPEGTLYLGNSVCWGSTLRRAVLPDKLKEIGAMAFTASDRLREVNIPDSVRILEYGCLSGCAIERLLIPSKTPVTKEICNNDWKLKEIVVMPGNETVKSIDGVIFSADGETLMAYPANKDSNEYEIPYGTLTIAGSAFYGAVNLKTVQIPESVTRLEDEAFGRSAIQTVYLPDSLESIGEAVFSGCRKLTEIVVSDSQRYFDSIENKYLYSKDHTVFYAYPAGLDERVYVMEPTTRMIKKKAFEYVKLTGIVLPEGLMEIGSQAFVSSELKSMYLPGTVEVISRQAFGFCRNLERVAIGYGVKTLEGWMFGDDIMLSEITIPETVKEIGDVSFLNVKHVRIYTTEGSYAQQYASQNQLTCETTPGSYERVTQKIREEIDLLATNGGSTEKVRVIITHNSTVNIREKPDVNSRRVGKGRTGEVYRWLETVEKEGRRWYKIELTDGTEGYVSAKMAEMLKEDDH